MMKSSPFVVGFGLVASFAFGQVVPTGVSIAISNEIAPAGAVTQVKIKLTEPKPIIRTGMKAAFDESFFDEFLGLAAAGGLTGVGVIDRGNLRLELSTFTPGLLSLDYPLVTIAVKTKPGLPVGYRVPVSMDLESSSWIDPNGVPFAKEIKAGSVTIGGSQFISNVLPGGGMLQPGQTFRVLGGGFNSSTKARAEGAKLRSVTANELLFEVKVPMRLDGEDIIAVNKAKEETEYFSYPRGIKSAASTNVALRGMVPVFSTSAHLVAQAGLSGNERAVVGIGIQNPTAAASVVAMELEDILGGGMAETKIFLGPGEVVFRSYEELFGASKPVGGFVIKAKSKTAFQFVVAEVDGAEIRVPVIVPVESAVY